MKQGRRVVGVLGLGVRRVVGRLTGSEPGRMIVCISGVALAIGLLVVVTGLAVGIAGGATVESEDIDYWIVPDDDGATDGPLPAEGVRLGGVHDVAFRLNDDDRVDYSTPALVEPIRIENPSTDEQGYVVVIGVIPPSDGRDVLGMSTAALDETYPHYDDGSYDGEWTGEVVLSPAAAAQLDASTGDELRRGSDRHFHVVDVADEDIDTAMGELPVVVVPLAELQTITGTAADDQADQILVATNDPSVQEEIKDIYPGTTVVTRDGFTGVSISATNLPVAMALAAGVVALGVGIAFVATMMGLELTATRNSLAVIDAVGFTGWSKTLVLIAETLTLASLGGIFGIGVGWAGIRTLNAGLAGPLDLPRVAEFTPLLAGYALLAALAVGLLSVAYPLYIAHRTEPLSELTR